METLVTFQILSLSGGGYRGLFSIEILRRLEHKAGRPLCECFDLIAGTSIGGIVAIGLALGKSAEQIKSLFMDKGETIFPPQLRAREGLLGKYDLYRQYVGGPKYDGIELRKAIVDLISERARIGDARTRLLIPAVNMTYGKVQMFKTAHHPRLETDYQRKAVDVAMATSAAPLFFPLAKIDDSYFADGGLVANAPDTCAIHEATQFCGQKALTEIRMLSIGTTTSRFALPTSLGASLGPAEWLENQRIVTTVFCAQQQLTEFMAGHLLGTDNYMRIDEIVGGEQAVDLGLDIADKKRRENLLGLADGAFQKIAGDTFIAKVLAHRPPPPKFHFDPPRQQPA